MGCFGSTEADVGKLGSSGANKLAVASVTPVRTAVRLPKARTFRRI